MRAQRCSHFCLSCHFFCCDQLHACHTLRTWSFVFHCLAAFLTAFLAARAPRSARGLQISQIMWCRKIIDMRDVGDDGGVKALYCDNLVVNVYIRRLLYLLVNQVQNNSIDEAMSYPMQFNLIVHSSRPSSPSSGPSSALQAPSSSSWICFNFSSDLEDMNLCGATLATLGTVQN